MLLITWCTAGFAIDSLSTDSACDFGLVGWFLNENNVPPALVLLSLDKIVLRVLVCEFTDMVTIGVILWLTFITIMYCVNLTSWKNRHVPATTRLETSLPRGLLGFTVYFLTIRLLVMKLSITDTVTSLLTDNRLVIIVQLMFWGAYRLVVRDARYEYLMTPCATPRNMM